jgi:hypothetical protein
MWQRRQETDSGTHAPGNSESIRIGLAGLLGLLCVALLAINAFDSEGTPEGAGSAAEAVVLTEFELLSRAERIEPRPYWVGRRPGVSEFRLERDADGNLSLRYLPEGATDDAESLTVAGYPLAEARQSLERAARSDGREVARYQGFVALVPKGDYSAYVVFDDQPELQVEVFSPVRGEAARLVSTGALTPLRWTPLT